MPPEVEKRINVGEGEKVRLIFKNGPIVDITSRPSPKTPYSVEQKSLDPREEERERLKARLPDVLLPHVRARLTQHSYQVVGDGEGAANDMSLMETQTALKNWMEDAKKAGMSDKDIIKDKDAILGQVVIGSKGEGKTSPLVKGIGTEINDMVNETYGMKRPKKTS